MADFGGMAALRRGLAACGAVLAVLGLSFFVEGSSVAGATGGSVSAVTVSISPPTVNAQNATYVFNFVATHGIGGSSPAITVVAPNGTSFLDTGGASLTDNTHPGDSQSIVPPCGGNTANVVMFDCFEGLGVASGDSVSLKLGGVINPGTASSSDTLTLSTNNDPTPVTSAPYALVVGKVGGLTVTPTPSANGYTNATYTFNFTATHGLSPNGVGPEITVIGPNSMSFNGSSAYLTDNSQPGDSGSICDGVGNANNILTLGCGDDFGNPQAGSGDSMTLKVTGVVSPKTPNAAYTLTMATNNDPTATTSPPYSITPQGYWLVASDGGIFSYGNASFLGSTGGIHLNKPIVGMAADLKTGGYWLVASDGGIFSFNAPFYGSMGGKPLNQPIVGMAATPDGGGYWFVASDGGIFSFGDAAFFGSMGGKHLNQPIVGMAATPDGGGYWFVAADGGIFSFGDAQFFGSMGATHLNKPIVGMAADAMTGGYWFVASDGGIFSFNAPFYGSIGGKSISSPIVGMVSSQSGAGYIFVAADGSIYAYGSAANEGAANGGPLNKPIVGMASTT